jgi:hypothetical protein
MTVTEFAAAPSRTVEGMLPGPELASALACVDLSSVDEFEVVEVLKAGRRLASWAASLEVRAAAELERRAVVSDGVDAVEFVTCEVEAALTLTSMAAGNLMHLARSLAERLPGTLTALIPWDQAHGRTPRSAAGPEQRRARRCGWMTPPSPYRSGTRTCWAGRRGSRTTSPVCGPPWRGAPGRRAARGR